MSLLDSLTQQITGSALSGLAGQLGADEGTTQSAITAALPMIVGALAKNASTNDGAASLTNALSKDHDGSILDNLGGFLSSTDNGSGAGILGHIFGGNRGMVEAGLSQMSGLGQGQAGNLLENLAPLVMGMLGKTKSQQGLDASGIAGLLLGERNNAQQTSGAAMSMISGLLDRDGDGSVIDDIGGLLGKFLK
ncbi:MAG: DUF937 domain-containing protein [Bacteroidota bacterium]